MTGHQSRFQGLMREQYEHYRVACQERGFPDLGYVLFLDRYFAHPASRLAFLGINPGGNEKVESCEPLDQHAIWTTRDPDRRYNDYWGMAREILKQVRKKRSDLAPVIDHAFYGNVIPFRSIWSKTSRPHQDLMRKYAAPVTSYLFEEDLYDIVIAVGDYPLKALAHQLVPLIPERKEVCIRFPEPGEKRPQRCADEIVHRSGGRSVRILKIPHLSRNLSGQGYNGAECIGNWLARRLPPGSD